MKLYTAHLKVHTVVRMKRAGHSRVLNVKLALIADDDVDADRRAKRWFAVERGQSTWSVRFGNGRWDAEVADLGEVFVYEESDGVVELS